MDIYEFDEVRYEKGIKEKAHEVYFMETIRDARWLPGLEGVVSGEVNSSLNNIDLDRGPTVENAEDSGRNTRVSKTDS